MSIFLKLLPSKIVFILFSLFFTFFSLNSFNEFAKAANNKKDSKLEAISNDVNKLSEFDEYILGPGDTLYIEFLNIRELSGSFKIGPSGHLYLPRVRDFYAEGFSIEELREGLILAFSEYLIKPDIYIRPISYRPIRVYVGGEVSKPGFYSLSGNTNSSFNSYDLNKTNNLINDRMQAENLPYIFPTLFDAIQTSSGVTPYSDLSNITVIRKIPKGQGGGKKKAELDFLSLLVEGNESQNIRLFDGDVIQVNKNNKVIREQLLTASRSNLSPDKLRVFVSGRVKMPGQITLPQGASLNQALVASDGPKLVRGRIEFVRFKNGGESERRIFNYAAEEPIASYKNPILMDGDLIRVQDNLLSATSTALGELTSPFIGVYSIYSFFNGVF